MRLAVDLGACRRSGQCSYLHPDLFEADKDGWPQVLVECPEGQQIEDAEDAADICPTSAIRLERED
jgi:ferredoxin